MRALVVIGTYLTTAQWMAAEAGIFVGIIAVGLWIMKITISSYWLVVIGHIAHAVTAAAVWVVAGVTFVNSDTISNAVRNGLGVGLL